MKIDNAILTAVLTGLCSSPEVSQRSPRSIAIKALQIAEAVADFKENGIPAKENK